MRLWGNKDDCLLCSNKGSYFGCRRCGRVNKEDGDKRSLRWVEKE